MKNFRIKEYQIHTPKMRGQKNVRFVLLADLHGLSYGKENEQLLAAIKNQKPDAVLVAGDMVVRTQRSTLVPASRLLKNLAKDFPVYYSLGNHEYKMYLSEEFRESYEKYENTLKKAGVHVLRNTQEHAILKGESFCFWGLELPLAYYHKPRSPKLSLAAMEELIGSSGKKEIQVLLAHNPKYGKTYFKWGADLILSGHYHGGVVRLSEHHGLSSPQYLILPPFCCGDFHKGSQHMFVSAGLGEHTIPLRIHNPRELLVIDVKPSEKKK